MGSPAQSWQGGYAFWTSRPNSPATPGTPGTPTSRRLMQLKVLYSLDGKNNFLARASDPVEVLPIPLGPTAQPVQYCAVSLIRCVDAILAQSPDLLPKLKHADFAVYAYDCLEEGTPQVGHGMLSWLLSDRERQNQPRIAGRVCKNITALFNNANNAETLEVKLNLTPAPYRSRREYQQQLEDFRNISPPRARPVVNTTVNDYQFMDMTFGQSYDMSSTASAYGPPIDWNGNGVDCSTPADSPQPGSPTKRRSVENIDPSQDLGVENVPPKKRARLTPASKPSGSAIVSDKTPLQLATTAASVRNYRPILPNLQEQPKQSDAPIRAPTPRPERRGSRGPRVRAPVPSSLRIDSSLTVPNEHNPTTPVTPESPSENVNENQSPRSAFGSSPPAYPSSPLPTGPATEAPTGPLSELPNGPLTELPTGPATEFPTEAFDVNPFANFDTDFSAVDEFFRLETTEPFDAELIFHDSAYYSEQPSAHRNDAGQHEQKSQLEQQLDLTLHDDYRWLHQIQPGEPSLGTTSPGETSQQQPVQESQTGETCVPRQSPVQQPPVQPSQMKKACIPQQPPVQQPEQNERARQEPQGQQSQPLSRGQSSDGSERIEKLRQQRLKTMPWKSVNPAATDKAARGTNASRRKERIVNRLDEAVAQGKVPRYCEDCGELETPTWRKLYSYRFAGPIPSDYTGLPIFTFRHPETKAIEHVVYKSRLSPNDSQFREHTLCNACGIHWNSHKKPRHDRVMVWSPQELIRHINWMMSDIVAGMHPDHAIHIWSTAIQRGDVHKLREARQAAWTALKEERQAALTAKREKVKQQQPSTPQPGTSLPATPAEVIEILEDDTAQAVVDGTEDLTFEQMMEQTLANMK
ncbi:hypothetical protein NA57DRAFT_52273 [Rhizodiscina lignyota]|uniref:Ams2/SPT21 N-terminal domain-containing protein n=1 Tax=Rhizodiscina lignyota TaxID=1504668 RepID=A0A9P4MCR3_9PEZI|nr:hypothetical protein NA57DRAFT_52273 [Rhizodiscina lignyota]